MWNSAGEPVCEGCYQPEEEDEQMIIEQLKELRDGITKAPWQSEQNGYVNQWHIYHDDNGGRDPIGVVYGGAGGYNRHAILALPEILDELIAMKGREAAREYAYKTILEYEEIIGHKVNDAFRIGWDMARTTNAQLGVTGDTSE